MYLKISFCLGYNSTHISTDKYVFSGRKKLGGRERDRKRGRKKETKRGRVKTINIHVEKKRQQHAWENGEQVIKTAFYGEVKKFKNL